jgi:hypothetical protein
MRVEPGNQPGDRKVEMEAGEARQSHPGHNVRYVLFFGVAGVVIAFAIIYYAFAG